MGRDVGDRPPVVVLGDLILVGQNRDGLTHQGQHESGIDQAGARPTGQASLAPSNVDLCYFDGFDNKKIYDLVQESVDVCLIKDKDDEYPEVGLTVEI